MGLPLLTGVGGRPQMYPAVKVCGRAEPIVGILSWSPEGDAGTSPGLGSSLLHAH